MADRLVTLTTFMFPSEALPLMGRLEAERIECILFEENIVAVDPFISNAVGGIKLKINEKDAKKALEILNQLNQELKKSEKKVDEKWEGDYVPVETYCPECESSSVFRKKFPFYKTMLIILVPPLALAFIVKKHYCADCGHVWKQ